MEFIFRWQTQVQGSTGDTAKSSPARRQGEASASGCKWRHNQWRSSVWQVPKHCLSLKVPWLHHACFSGMPGWKEGHNNAKNMTLAHTNNSALHTYILEKSCDVLDASCQEISKMPVDWVWCAKESGWILLLFYLCRIRYIFWSEYRHLLICFHILHSFSCLSHLH